MHLVFLSRKKEAPNFNFLKEFADRWSDFPGHDNVLLKIHISNGSDILGPGWGSGICFQHALG